MNTENLNYVPCLRWKQGEYQALFKLPIEIKSLITPLIEVPEIGWDFENKKELKTVDKLLEPIAKRIKIKWGDKPYFIDMNLIDPQKRMLNGKHPLNYLFDSLRKENYIGIPVIGLNRTKSYINEIRNIISKDKKGVCFRIRIIEAAKADLKSKIDDILMQLKISHGECDLILDLETPAFTPIDGFCKAIISIIQKLPYLNKWRTFTIIGTAFPQTMAEIKTSPEIVKRNEWILYKMLVNDLKEEDIRIPTFGDYAIAHPAVLKVDMRIVKPSASIRYTIDNSWYILKGKTVRQKNGYEQYRQLSQILVSSSYYEGPAFSHGDMFISECASGSGTTGHLTKWRTVGTNHHITKVIQDISNFGG